MDLPLIILVIIGIVLLLLIIKITAKIFRIILSLAFILFLVFGVLGYFVYKDVMDIKENMADSENVFLLVKDTAYIAGFIGAFSEEATEEEMPFTAITQTELEDYKTQSYESILGDRFKILFIEPSTFDKVDEISFGDKTFTREEAFTLIESEDPLSDSNLSAESLGMDNDRFRSALFGMLLAKSFDQGGPKFFISSIRSERITVYPETITFKLLRLLP